MGRASKPRLTVQVSQVINACDFYRNYMPIKALDEHDAVSARMSQRFGIMDCYGSDIVILSRPRDANILNLLGPASWLGTKFVVDYDDDIFGIPTSNYCRPNFGANEARTSGEICKRAHCVSASTPRLKSLLSQYNKNVCVIPNTVDNQMIEYHTKDWIPREDDFFHIVWAGSVTHVEDQKIIVEPIKALLKKYSDIRVTFFGWCYNELVEQFPGKVNYHPMVDLFHYLRVLRDMQPSLVIQPLMDHDFNYSKSNIRWLEAGSFGFPCMASDVPSFKMLTDKFCLLAPWNEEAWYAKLDWAYNNQDKVKLMGERSREVINKYWTIDKMWPAWKEHIYGAWNDEPCTKDFTPDMEKIWLEEYVTKGE